MKDLLTRSITGILFVGVLIAALLIHPILFFITFLLIEILALNEFFRFARKGRTKPQIYYGGLVGAYIFASSFMWHISDYGMHLALLTIPLLAFILIFELYRNYKRPIFNIAATVFGLVYISFGLSLTTHIVYFGGEFNGQLLLGVFILMWASDSGAYLFGVSFGKTKLFERISPKKSWEGFLGGAVSSIGISYVISKYFVFLAFENWLIISILVVLFGTLGDLVESMFKRSVEVKDSGNVLPGHGGILDRFDSMLLAIPLVFTYLYFFVR